MPGAQHNLKAFVQQTCNHICQHLRAQDVLYDPQEQVVLLNQRKDQQRFKKESEILSKAAKPQLFMDKTPWYDWEKLFNK